MERGKFEFFYIYIDAGGSKSTRALTRYQQDIFCFRLIYVLYSPLLTHFYSIVRMGHCPFKSNTRQLLKNCIHERDASASMKVAGPTAVNQPDSYLVRLFSGVCLTAVESRRHRAVRHLAGCAIYRDVAVSRYQLILRDTVFKIRPSSPLRTPSSNLHDNI